MRKDSSGASHGLGVSLEVRSSGNNYKVRINHAGLQLNLGRFADAHTARLAFDQAAVRLRGPEAPTNYPAGSFQLDNPKVEKKLQQFLRSLGGERHPAGAGDVHTDSGSGKTGSDDPGPGEEQLQEAAVLQAAAAIARSASADRLAAWMAGQPAASQQQEVQAPPWGQAGGQLDLTAAGAEAAGAECADDISHLLSWAHLQDFQQDDTELQQILAAGSGSLPPWQQQLPGAAPSQAFAQDESPFTLAVSMAEAAAAGSEGVPRQPPPQLPLQQQQLVWQGPPVPLTLQRQPTLVSSSSGGSQSDSGPSSQPGSQLHQQYDQQPQAAVTSVMRSFSGAWGQQPSQQPAALAPQPPAATGAPPQPRPAAMPDAACLLMPAGSYGSTYTFASLPPLQATSSGGLLYGSLPPPPAALPMAGSMPSTWFGSGLPPAALLPSVGSTGSAYTSAVSLLQTAGSTGSTYDWTAPVRPPPAAVVTPAGAASGSTLVVPALLVVSGCSRAALRLRGHLLTSTNQDALGSISDWYTYFEQAGGQSAAVRRVLGRVAEALAHAPTGGVASPASPIARADALQLLEAVARAFGSLHQQLLMVAQSQQAPASTAAAAAAVVQQWLAMLSLPDSGAAAPGRPPWLQAAVVLVAYQLKSEVTAALQALQN